MIDMRLEVVEPSFELMTPRSWFQDVPKFLEKCGRTCYKSETLITDDSASKFIDMLLKRGHESVIEHFFVTYKIIGSRSMSHQLVRHRLASYSQESQRFCDYSPGRKKFQIICPPSVGLSPGIYEKQNNDWIFQRSKLNNSVKILYLRTIFKSYSRYIQLRDQGIKPEDAREVLPNATKTEVVTTFNLRQWRHVLGKGPSSRALNPHSQWQIRDIMQGILVDLYKLLPSVFSDLYEELN